LQSARGWHPFNSFYDEADFAAHALLTIVLPLQSEKNHVLFALSSPNTQGGLYSDMINAKDENGKNLLNVKVIGQACDACRRAGLWAHCTHSDRSTASWKDPEKTKRLTAIYAACNMKSIIDGELGGSLVGGLQPVFNQKTVDALRMSFDDKRFAAIPDTIDAAICAVDPAGGGSSEMALVILGISSTTNRQYVRKMMFSFLLSVLLCCILDDEPTEAVEVVTLPKHVARLDKHLCRSPRLRLAEERAGNDR